MDIIQNDTIKKEKPDNIFIIIGIILINSFIIWHDAIASVLTNHLDLIIFSISLITLVFLDSRHLIKLKYTPTISASWVILFGVFFYFVWVWQRYTWIGDKVRLLFWVLLISVCGSFYYSYNLEYSRIISESACDLSTQILKEQFNRPDLKCTKVIKIEEVDRDSNFYKAIAVLNDGTMRNITIDSRDDNGENMIHVTLYPIPTGL